jgi:hypothetical protein
LTQPSILQPKEENVCSSKKYPYVLYWTNVCSYACHLLHFSQSTIDSTVILFQWRRIYSPGPNIIFLSIFVENRSAQNIGLQQQNALVGLYVILILSYNVLVLLRKTNQNIFDLIEIN